MSTDHTSDGSRSIHGGGSDSDSDVDKKATTTTRTNDQDYEEDTGEDDQHREDEGNNDENQKEADDLAAALTSQLHIAESDEDQATGKVTKKPEIVREVVTKEPPLPSPPKELVEIANWIVAADRILVLTGAGVSVAAGIPDFRTPGTGLYDNLSKYNLPYAEAVFDIDYFRRNPQPFCQLAAELWPTPITTTTTTPTTTTTKQKGFQPTRTHHFLRLLADRKKLLRLYSQNIDGLEHLAGIDPELLVECHGHFRSASCIDCGTAMPIDEVREAMVERGVAPECPACRNRRGRRPSRPAYVKPDIVFFGESLPARFSQCLERDVPRADLCLILGTSLQVPPVAHIPNLVSCRRVLLNRERVGSIGASSSSSSSRRASRGGHGDGAAAEDRFYAGDCDAIVTALAHVLGWWQSTDDDALRGTTTTTTVTTDDE